MSLGRLRIESVRNIKSAYLELGSGLNLFVGGNGSGKTSLLESIYLLSTGRTFRTPGTGPLINHDASSCTVYGEIKQEDGAKFSVGVMKHRSNKGAIHINGEANQQTSRIAQLLPTILLGPLSIDLVEGPPGLRRRYLNWAAFHVEPGFNSVWVEAQQGLKQRNILLKNRRASNSEFESWTKQFAAAAEKVNHYRQRIFDLLQPAISDLVLQFLPSREISLAFYPGWERDSKLEDVLLRNKDREFERGFSQWGHQRADIRITTKGLSANGVLSRGELKLVAWIMLISQGTLFNSVSGERALYLVDDLKSELDKANSQKIHELLSLSGSQICLTGTDFLSLDTMVTVGSKLFHVERGVFQEKEIVS